MFSFYPRPLRSPTPKSSVDDEARRDDMHDGSNDHRHRYHDELEATPPPSDYDDEDDQLQIRRNYLMSPAVDINSKKISKLSLLEKQKLFLQRRAQRVEQLRQAQMEAEEAELTFRPQVNHKYSGKLQRWMQNTPASERLYGHAMCRLENQRETHERMEEGELRVYQEKMLQKRRAQREYTQTAARVQQIAASRQQHHQKVSLNRKKLNIGTTITTTSIIGKTDFPHTTTGEAKSLQAPHHNNDLSPPTAVAVVEVGRSQSHDSHHLPPSRRGGGGGRGSEEAHPPQHNDPLVVERHLRFPASSLSIEGGGEGEQSTTPNSESNISVPPLPPSPRYRQATWSSRAMRSSTETRMVVGANTSDRSRSVSAHYDAAADDMHAMTLPSDDPRRFPFRPEITPYAQNLSSANNPRGFKNCPPFVAPTSSEEYLDAAGHHRGQAHQEEEEGENSGTENSNRTMAKIHREINSALLTAPGSKYAPLMVSEPQLSFIDRVPKYMELNRSRDREHSQRYHNNSSGLMVDDTNVIQRKPAPYLSKVEVQSVVDRLSQSASRGYTPLPGPPRTARPSSRSNTPLDREEKRTGGQEGPPIPRVDHEQPSRCAPPPKAKKGSVAPHGPTFLSEERARNKEDGKHLQASEEQKRQQEEEERRKDLDKRTQRQLWQMVSEDYTKKLESAKSKCFQEKDQRPGSAQRQRVQPQSGEDGQNNSKKTEPQRSMRNQFEFKGKSRTGRKFSSAWPLVAGADEQPSRSLLDTPAANLMDGDGHHDTGNTKKSESPPRRTKRIVADPHALCIAQEAEHVQRMKQAAAKRQALQDRSEPRIAISW